MCLEIPIQAQPEDTEMDPGQGEKLLLVFIKVSPGSVVDDYAQLLLIIPCALMLTASWPHDD